MRVPAVDFHDQALIAPEEIDFESIDLHIHLGLGKAVVAAEGGRDAGRSQLRRRNHAMLPRGEPGNEGVWIRFVAFCPHVREEGDKRPDSPPSSPVFVPRSPDAPLDLPILGR